MTTPRACPVVGCCEKALGSLVIYMHPDGGLGRNRMIPACPSCWRAVGDGATVHVEYESGDTGRRSPIVVLGEPARV